ncbi:MAG: mechanosensitive ion channel family protein [Spirochaetaceae bacterium]|jgi:MscS family membrane protein|nr:mechanosensitive ion channel family protein [Spirochaetaceae bacterium]
MYKVIQLFTNWSIVNLFYGILILVTIVFILELIIAIAIKRRKNRVEIEGIDFIVSLLKISRVLYRFELIYLFLRIIELPHGALYPWNLVYEVSVLFVMFTGFIVPIHMILNITLKYFNEKNGNELQRKLLSISNRGIKITLFFLAFSISLWKILGLLPLEMRNSFFIKSILIANGLLFSLIIIVVIQKSFKSAQELLLDKKSAYRRSIIVKSLSVPVQMLIASLTLLWFKKLVVDLPVFHMIIDKTIYFLLLAAILVFIFRLIEIIGGRLSLISVENTNNLDKTLVEMIRMILRITLIFIGTFGVIRIITGKPLTTLLAGLGIGGLALALAAQDTLKNFFGSIMIMTDKPFKIGERIQIKEYDGIVEAIGFRSTRLRTLVGHQVVIPNDQMASNPIENVGRRPHIRRLTNITVTYGTSPEKMEKALSIIKGILDNHEGMPDDFPPRVFFSEFNADSLNIMMIYWYAPPDYWKFMSFSENVNLQIMKEFSAENIEFAFPTTTTFLEQADGQSIRFQMEKDLKND